MTLIASIPNCTDLYSLATHGLTSPAVTAQTSTAAFSGSSVDVTIPLLINNPNDFPISLDSVEYAVSFGTACVYPRPTTATGPGFSGTQEGVTVDENATEQLKLHQTVPLAAFPSAATNNYTVCGVVHADSPAGVAIDVEFNSASTING